MRSMIIDTNRIQFQTITVTFLEMYEPKGRPNPINETSFSLLSKPISAEEYRKYYYGVGEKWHWLDRMVMPDKELEQKINAANVDIFVFHINNQPAGFAEFVKEKDWTEIQYFGLLPAFIGKGWGHYFLQWVIGQAWSYRPGLVQLNTCTLDHPNALTVYRKAGFTAVRTTTEQRRILV